VADEIYSNLTGPDDGAPDSVHLSDWPAAIAERADDLLRRRMTTVRKIVALGRAARTNAKVRVRQPLATALVVMPRGEVGDVEGLEGMISEELNVKAIELVAGLEEFVSYTVKPNFKQLGPRFGAQVRAVADVLASTDARALVSALEESGEAHLKVDGETVVLGSDDLDVRIEGREGFALAQEGPYGVALDVELTPELVAEGVAREVVRAVQDLRKAAGLAVEDRIELWLDSEMLRDAIDGHGDFIASEVLATEVHIGAALPEDAHKGSVTVDSADVTIGLRRAGSA
jgi:isoleucyl-tRNA synthetase